MIRTLIYLLIISTFFIPGCKFSHEETPNIDPPKVETGEIDALNRTVTGRITDASDGIIEYGHIWSKESTPSLTDNRTQNGASNNVGPFTSQMTGLEVDETYYVQAYVIDKIEALAVGTIKSFTVLPRPYQLSTGIFQRQAGEKSGSITSQIQENGDLAVKSFGHVWSLQNPPTLSDHVDAQSGLVGNTFSSTIEPEFEEYGKTLYIRSFLEDKQGNIYYGEEIESIVVNDVWVQLDVPPGFPAMSDAYVFVRNDTAYILTSDDFQSEIWHYDLSSKVFSARFDRVFQILTGGMVFSVGHDVFYTYNPLASSFHYCHRMYKFEISKQKFEYISFIDTVEVLSDAQYCYKNGVAIEINGKGYFGFGEDFSDRFQSKALYEFDPLTSTVRRVATGINSVSKGMAFTVKNKGYFTGGFPGFQGNSKDVMEFDPATDSIRILTEPFVGPADIAYGVSFAINDKGYITSGEDNSLSPVNGLYEFDPDRSPQWSQKQSFPGTPRSRAIVFVLNGKAFFGTGEDEGRNKLNDMWMYVP